MRLKHVLLSGSSILILCGLAASQKQENASKPQTKPAQEQPKPAETKKPRPRVITDLSGFDLLESSKLKKQTQVAGATRGMASPVALAPRLGKLYGNQPVFSWRYEGRAKNFLFILWDDAEKELFRSEVSGFEYRYPATAPALEPGKTYFWTVEVASAMLAGEPSSPAGFLCLSTTQRAEIEKDIAASAGADDYRSGLARARVFRDRRLWYDALDAYSALIARYPERAEPYEERGMIYAQFETTEPLAEKDFARVQELQNAVKH